MIELENCSANLIFIKMHKLQLWCRIKAIAEKMNDLNRIVYLQGVQKRCVFLTIGYQTKNLIKFSANQDLSRKVEYI